MFKKICCLIVAGAFALSAATPVSLTGTVKDEGGAAVAGANVTLAKVAALKATTDAQGAFTLTGEITGVSAPYAITVHQQSQITGSGKFVQFTIGQAASNANVAFYSGSGRQVASLSLGKLTAGRHNIALPSLAPGCYLMHVTVDQITVTNRLLNTGSAVYISNIENGSAAAGSLNKTTAAAAVDELVVSKTGFTTAKVALDSYTKTGIAVVLKVGGVEVCKTVELPASSGLTKVNAKLPDPFTFYDGTKMTKKSQWECRRQEILAMAQKYVYGPCPPKPEEVTGTVSGGTITINCKQGSKTATFSAKISGSGDAICLKLSGGIYPTGAKTLDVGSGNASKIQTLYGVSGMIENLATAWMVDRVIDVLELNPSSGHDPKKIMVSGCSGCGKGAFLVGVFSRIPLTVIVESGGGGAANFRQAEWFRHGGGSSGYKCPDAKPQNIDNLEDNGICGPWVSSVAQWLRSSPAKVNNLPYDQHSLLACVAPRYLCHFTNQHGSGEWCHLGGTCEALSAWAAKPVFKALGIPENMGFVMYTEGSAPGHCSNPSSATTLANQFFNRVFKGDTSAKTDVFNANDSDLQQKQGEWKAMWVDWDMDTKLE